MKPVKEVRLRFPTLSARVVNAPGRSKLCIPVRRQDGSQHEVSIRPFEHQPHDQTGTWCPRLFQQMQPVAEYVGALTEFMEETITQPDLQLLKEHMANLAAHFIAHAAAPPLPVDVHSGDTFRVARALIAYRVWEAFTRCYFLGLPAAIPAVHTAAGSPFQELLKKVTAWLHRLVGEWAWRREGPASSALQEWIKSFLERLHMSAPDIALEVKGEWQLDAALPRKVVKRNWHRKWYNNSETFENPVYPYRITGGFAGNRFSSTKDAREDIRGVCGVPSENFNRSNNIALCFLALADIREAVGQAAKAAFPDTKLQKAAIRFFLRHILRMELADSSDIGPQDAEAVRRLVLKAVGICAMRWEEALGVVDLYVRAAEGLRGVLAGRGLLLLPEELGLELPGMESCLRELVSEQSGLSRAQVGRALEEALKAARLPRGVVNAEAAVALQGVLQPLMLPAPLVGPPPQQHLLPAQQTTAPPPQQPQQPPPPLTLQHLASPPPAVQVPVLPPPPLQQQTRKRLLPEGLEVEPTELRHSDRQQAWAGAQRHVGSSELQAAASGFVAGSADIAAIAGCSAVGLNAGSPGLLATQLLSTSSAASTSLPAEALLLTARSGSAMARPPAQVASQCEMRLSKKRFVAVHTSGPGAPVMASSNGGLAAAASGTSGEALRTPAAGDGFHEGEIMAAAAPGGSDILAVMSLPRAGAAGQVPASRALGADPTAALAGDPTRGILGVLPAAMATSHRGGRASPCGAGSEPMTLVQPPPPQQGQQQQLQGSPSPMPQQSWLWYPSASDLETYPVNSLFSGSGALDSGGAGGPVAPYLPQPPYQQQLQQQPPQNPCVTSAPQQLMQPCAVPPNAPPDEPMDARTAVTDAALIRGLPPSYGAGQHPFGPGALGAGLCSFGPVVMPALPAQPWQPRQPPLAHIGADVGVTADLQGGRFLPLPEAVPSAHYLYQHQSQIPNPSQYAYQCPNQYPYPYQQHSPPGLQLTSPAAAQIAAPWVANVSPVPSPPPPPLLPGVPPAVPEIASACLAPQQPWACELAPPAAQLQAQSPQLLLAPPGALPQQSHLLAAAQQGGPIDAASVYSAAVSEPNFYSFCSVFLREGDC